MAVLTKSYQLLATSGSKNFNSTIGKIKLYAKYNSQDIDNNSTNVTWRAVINFSAAGTYDSTGRTLRITNATTNKNSGAKSVSKGSSSSNAFPKGDYELGTWNEIIEHNSDGTKSVNANANMNFAAWGISLIATATNVSMPKIPRNTKIALDNEIKGAGQTINCISRANFILLKSSNDYTTKLEYSWNGHNGILTENLINDLALSFTGSAITDSNYQCLVFPYTFLNIASELQNSKETIIQLILKTYNGATQIGDTFTYDYNFKIGEVIPTAICKLETTDSLSYTLSGNRTTFINGISNIKAEIQNVIFNNTAVVKNYLFNGNGESVKQSSYQYNFKNKVSIANDIFDFSVESSRGNIYSVGQKKYSDYVVKDYTSLALTKCTAERADTTSSTVNINIEGTYWNKSFGSVTNNIKLISIKMISDSNSVSTKTITPSYNENKFTASTTFNLSTSNSAIFEITIADQAITLPVQKIIVSSSVSNFDIGDGYFGINSDLYMNNHKILGVSTPTSNNDGANKKYVDDKNNITSTTLNTKIEDNCIYKDGDIYKLDYYYGAGFLTGSGKAYYLATLFTPKSLKNIESVSLNEGGKLIVRQKGNYLVGTGSAAQNMNLSYCSASKVGDNAIGIVFNAPGVASGSINNENIGVYMTDISIRMNGGDQI